MQKEVSWGGERCLREWRRGWGRARGRAGRARVRGLRRGHRQCRPPGGALGLWGVGETGTPATPTAPPPLPGFVTAPPLPPLTAPSRSPPRRPPGTPRVCGPVRVAASWCRCVTHTCLCMSAPVCVCVCVCAGGCKSLCVVWVRPCVSVTGVLVRLPAEGPGRNTPKSRVGGRGWGAF